MTDIETGTVEVIDTPRRKRRKADEVAPAAVVTVMTPLEEIEAALKASAVGNHVAEKYISVARDGRVERVEMRAFPGTTFIVPDQGTVVWATYTGIPSRFKEFLDSVRVSVTIDG